MMVTSKQSHLLELNRYSGFSIVSRREAFFCCWTVKVAIWTVKGGISTVKAVIRTVKASSWIKTVLIWTIK
ncbi:hypothetical protein ACSVDA_12185 [Cytobacillus sp. Hm23]